MELHPKEVESQGVWQQRSPVVGRGEDKNEAKNMHILFVIMIFLKYSKNFQKF